MDFSADAVDALIDRLPACLVPRPVRSSAPLLVARCLTHCVRLRSSVSSFVPSCVSPPVSFSCRLASSSRYHLVPSCPMCRTAYRQSCGRAVLPSSSYRSPHALPSSLSHNRMSDDAGRARIPHHGHAAGRQGANEPQGNEPHTYRDDMETRRPRRNISFHTRKTIRRMKRKTRRASKTSQQDDMTRRRNGDTGIGRDATRETQIRRNETSKQDETMNEMRNETPNKTNKNDTSKQQETTG